MIEFKAMVLRGFALALAVLMPACVVDNYAGPAITLSGGYQDWSLSVTLLGRPKPKPQPDPVAEAAALLSVQGLPAPDPKQPISAK